ncbi:hemerythrin domain-containing protein [Xenophilus azovorans]|uniref:bacteriohemerythrin n=1 Tax=Xenophilus azovorans TaxID=151755 RepID=UPI0009FC0898
MKCSEDSDHVGEAGFAWDDRYLVGYKSMDVTHQDFVALVDALLVADDLQFPSALEAFRKHAEEHFSDEKKWMDSGEFPHRDCHVEEHEKVLSSVIEVQALVAGGNIAIGRELSKALRDWFPGHVDYMDSALANWLVQRQFSGTPVVLKRKQAKA